MNYRPSHFYPSPSPSVAAPSSSGQLKSCLRRGNFSRGRADAGTGYGMNASGTTVPVGSGLARSSPMVPQHQQQQLQYEYQYEQQTTTRSVASAPTIRSVPSTHTNRSTATHRSSSSDPTCSNARNDREKAAENERQFMRISKMLVTQHMTGRYSDPYSLRNLLYDQLAQLEQRRDFYDCLKRNVAFLPMFPEPNEHPSLAMTRYVQKMFGPILAQEFEPNGSQGARNTTRHHHKNHYSAYQQQHQQVQRQPDPISVREYGPMFPSKLQSSINPVDNRFPATTAATPHQQPESTIPPPIPIPTHNWQDSASSALPQSTYLGTVGTIIKGDQQSSLFNFTSSSGGTELAPGAAASNSNHPTNAYGKQPLPAHFNFSSPREVAASSAVRAGPTSEIDNKALLQKLPAVQAPVASIRMSEAKTPKASNLAVATETTAPISPASGQHNVTFSPSAMSSLASSSTIEQSQGSLLHQSGELRTGNIPSNAPLPKPLSFASNNASQFVTATPMTSDRAVSPLSHSLDQDKENNAGMLHQNQASKDLCDDGSKSDDTVTSDIPQMEVAPQKQQYQTFTNKDMLPPITSREKILYYPYNPSEREREALKSSCCDFSSSSRQRKMTNESKLLKRPPTYLQLYIKCERSEPFANKDLDIVTWYTGRDNRVTADRTLVVRATTDMVEVINGIVESFGLSSENINSLGNGDSAESSESLLGCYKDICFISDTKMTRDRNTNEVSLTPLPIPGFHYKYVDRDGSLKKGSNGSGGKKGSSVLSTDPCRLQRTLVAQLLDNPIHGSSPISPSQYSGNNKRGERSRIALVYCTPKRNACVSNRSVHKGTMPETIYHFQILLEGIVAEDDLPSSFQSQASIRCVGATGGVLGGSVIDTQGEINELNRTLWNKKKVSGGDRDVVGLATPKPTSDENLEQIIVPLSVPLFDIEGNQLPKEFVVDRCLYNIYSGKLSMEVARQTQHTMEAIENTTEWLAQRVEAFTKELSDGVTACEDDVEALIFDHDGLHDFDDFGGSHRRKYQYL